MDSMTPQEVYEYKKRWLMYSNHYAVTDELLEYSAKRWCRNNVPQHKWSFSKYTDFYEDTFYFEDESDKVRFTEQFLAS